MEINQTTQTTNQNTTTSKQDNTEKSSISFSQELNQRQEAQELAEQNKERKQ